METKSWIAFATSGALLSFVVGIGLGALLGREVAGGEGASSDGHDMRKPLTALVGGSGATRRLREIHAAHGDSFYRELREVLALVRDVEIDELPDLIREMERAIPIIYGSYPKQFLLRRFAGEAPLELLALLARNASLANLDSELIVQAALDRDPEKALEMIHGIGDLKLRKRLLGEAIEHWSSTDPSRALVEISRIVSLYDREEVLFKNFRVLGEKAPELAIAALAQLSHRPGRSYPEIQRLLMDLAAADIADAIAKCELIDDPDRKRAAVIGMASGLQPTDFERALAWARAQPHPDPLVGAILTLGKDLPALEALAEARKISSLSERRDAISSIGADWIEADPKTATRWIDENLSWSLREETYESVIYGASVSGNQQPLVSLIEILNPESEEAHKLFQTWLRIDREMASSYADSLEDGPRRAHFQQLLSEIPSEPDSDPFE